MKTRPIPCTIRRASTGCTVPADRRRPGAAPYHGRALMAPAVSFRATVVLAGRFPALSGVDLDVRAGESVLVEGPNGAGKTTLLRTCAGLLPIAGGTASVLGADLARDRRSIRRQVGYLGHAAGLYDDLSVAENVRFWVRAAGGDPATV